MAYLSKMLPLLFQIFWAAINHKYPHESLPSSPAHLKSQNQCRSIYSTFSTLHHPQFIIQLWLSRYVFRIWRPTEKETAKTASQTELPWLLLERRWSWTTEMSTGTSSRWWNGEGMIGIRFRSSRRNSVDAHWHISILQLNCPTLEPRV